MKLEQ